MAQVMLLMGTMSGTISDMQGNTDKQFREVKANLDTTNLQVNAVAEHQERQDRRADEAEEEVRTIADATNTNAREHAALMERLRLVENRLGIAEDTNIVYTPAGDYFDRTPDPTVLKLDTQDLTTKESIITATAEWLDRFNLDSTAFTITGKDVDKKYTLSFHGALNLAAIRVQDALRLFKKDGKYIQMFGTVDKTGANSKMFVNIDKNSKTSKSEMCTRNLGRIMQDMFNDRIGWSRRDYCLYFDTMPLCSIDVKTAEADPIIIWDHDVRNKMPQFNRTEVLNKLIASIKRNHTKVDKTTWSV